MMTYVVTFARNGDCVVNGRIVGSWMRHPLGDYRFESLSGRTFSVAARRDLRVYAIAAFNTMEA